MEGYGLRALVADDGEADRHRASWLAGGGFRRTQRTGALHSELYAAEDADGSKVSVEYEDGVLKVHVPKSEKTKPKSIDVEIG